MAHLDSTGLLLKDLKDNLSTGNQVELPIRPELENYVSSDPTNSPGDYHRRPAIYPAGTSVFDDLLDESADGNEATQLQRGFEVKRQKITQYTHDTDWAASGSARQVHVSAGQPSRSPRRLTSRSRSSSSARYSRLSSDPGVVIIAAAVFWSIPKKPAIPGLAQGPTRVPEKLRHLITSVIVGRGLTLRLNFTTDYPPGSWRDLKIKVPAACRGRGRSACPATTNSHTTWDLKDVSENSITFVDGPKVCRVLGLKVEDVLGAGASGTF